MKYFCTNLISRSNLAFCSGRQVSGKVVSWNTMKTLIKLILLITISFNIKADTIRSAKLRSEIVTLKITDSITPIDSLYKYSYMVAVVKIYYGQLIDNNVSYEAKVLKLEKGDIAITNIKFTDINIAEVNGMEIGSKYLIFLGKDTSSNLYPMEYMKIEYARFNNKRNIKYYLQHPKYWDEVIKIPTAVYIIPKSIKSYTVELSNKLWTDDNIYNMKYVLLSDMEKYLSDLKRIIK